MKKKPFEGKACPKCGSIVHIYSNPIPTVDAIIKIYRPDTPDKPQGIVLIERKNPPHGWAIPGGFVDYGESLEESVVREAKEETSLDITIIGLLGAYSDPKRDQRHHTISNVFVGKAFGEPQAGDDAKNIGVFNEDSLPENIVFDHPEILKDFFNSSFWQKDKP